MSSESNHPLILVADDDSDVIAVLTHMLNKWGYRTVAALSKGELMARLSQERPLLILLDLKFGDTDGLELLQQLRSCCPDLPIALLTGNGAIETAVSAMRLGAFDYLTKPPDSNRLQMLIAHAIEVQSLRAKVRKLESLTGAAPGLRMFGESPAIRKVFALIQSVAPTDVTAIILGESGTGKELAAQMIHDLSQHRDGPFIPLNMAALPRELAESLLFGHEKGAFTGADRAQAGACELANNGTLFLDEIGEMDLTLQAKLLRFLQERTVQRVGNPKSIAVNVRVVSATNRDLAERVRAGHFREDLYYRLNVVPIRLPPLRERPEDIRPLAIRFLQRATTKYHRSDLHFSPAALDALASYDWPGNVRQLENLIERVAILSAGPEVGPEAFIDDFRTVTATTIDTDIKSNAPSPKVSNSQPSTIDQGQNSGLRVMDQMERQAIFDSLTRFGGSVKDVAHTLGLSQATVYRKLKRYAINLDDFTKKATIS